MRCCNNAKASAAPIDDLTMNCVPHCLGVCRGMRCCNNAIASAVPIDDLTMNCVPHSLSV